MSLSRRSAVVTTRLAAFRIICCIDLSGAAAVPTTARQGQGETHMARRPNSRKLPRRKPGTRSTRAPTRAAEATSDPAQRGSAAAALSDEAVEEALRTGDHPALLEDLFGAPGYAQLRGLAQQAAARSV